jgi:hypothetical protein
LKVLNLSPPLWRVFLFRLYRSTYPQAYKAFKYSRTLCLSSDLSTYLDRFGADRGASSGDVAGWVTEITNLNLSAAATEALMNQISLYIVGPDGILRQYNLGDLSRMSSADLNTTNDAEAAAAEQAALGQGDC